MRQGRIRLGSISGIAITLHYSWFVIAALLTMSLAGQLTAVNDTWPAALIWGLAAVTAVAFFAAILLHELSHAVVARARGTPVPSITLFALGGVAQMGREPDSARSEFLIAIAGPIASVVLGLSALQLAAALGWTFDATPRSPGLAMLVWFGFINLTLALFNLIPGFPLDGGRVLRAAIWGWTGDHVRGTRIAAGIGQIFAVGLIVVGILSMFRGAGLGGLWLALIGMFLSGAARAEMMQTTMMHNLRGVRVGDIMSRDCPTIDRGQPVADIADTVLRTGMRCFFIMDRDRVAGLLTLRDLRAVPRDRWLDTSAADVMQPVERLHHVDADAPVAHALAEIGRRDVNQLPVLDHGRLEGIISRDQILRLLSARAELST